ncbi:MAG: VOC family protein [Stackebrandtia sp.]
MSVQLNHTIVTSVDRQTTADFWGDILGLEVGKAWGPFIPIDTANGVTLDFVDVPEEDVKPQHYAFLVSEAEFDAGFAKITERELTFWADPHSHVEGEINYNDGGRGVYFLDPNGHFMELITVPYGGWPKE